MLRFGTVTSINPLTARARVQFAEDGMNSYWLAVLQNKTFKDKFYSMPAVGEQVACLMDQNSEDGVILGAIYSNEDKPAVTSEKQLSVNLENGSQINADKETDTLTVIFQNIKLVGDITHEGILTNTNGIKSNADITDKKSSMQSMRDKYNSKKRKARNHNDFGPFLVSYLEVVPAAVHIGLQRDRRADVFLLQSLPAQEFLQVFRPPRRVNDRDAAHLAGSPDDGIAVA